MAASPTGSVPLHALLGALNLSSDAIVVYEPVLDDNNQVGDLRVAMLNEAAVRMFNMSRDLCLGMSYDALWGSDREKFVWMRLLDVHFTGVPGTYEWEMYSGGETKWYDVSLKHYNGHIAASYHDITERKKNMLAEQAQRRFYEEVVASGLRRKTVLYPVRDALGAVEDFRYD